jgi:hypothetical protein
MDADKKEEREFNKHLQKMKKVVKICEKYRVRSIRTPEFYMEFGNIAPIRKVSIKKTPLATLLRSRLINALKGKRSAKAALLYLGCTLEDLRQHLESLFKPGMTWENHGSWHIDHIRPLASFDLTKEENLYKACHYTNLQPLWAKENLKKGSKYGAV